MGKSSDDPHLPDHRWSAAELEELQRTQTELWADLKNEVDPVRRMRLLSRLSRNRSLLLASGRDGGLGPSGGAPPALEAGPLSNGHGPDNAVNGHEPVDDPELGDHDRLHDGFDLVDGEEPNPTDPVAAALLSMNTLVDGGHVDDDRRFGGTDDPSAAAVTGPQPMSPPPPPGPGDRVPTSPTSLAESPARILLLVGLLVAMAGLTWLALSRSSDDSGDTASADVEAGGDADRAGGAVGGAGEIEAMLDGMGYGDVVVEQRETVVYLSGTVDTETDRQNVLVAVSALADGAELDSSQLLAGPEDVAAPTTDAQSATASRPDVLQSEIDRIVAATPLIFESGQSELTDLHQRILNNVAASILAYPELGTSVIGYTDDLGADADNEVLSQARADAVREYLVSQGVPESALTAEAKGEVTATGSAALANLERRVEFQVHGAGAGGVAPPGPNPETLRIAVVAPSAGNDLAFSQSMVDAVDVIAAERGNVEVTVVDNMYVPDEAAAEMRQFAADGYDLVIGHGSQYGSAVAELAPEFPDVVFAWGTAFDTFGLPNVYSYDAASHEGGFVMGYMSAMLTSSQVIGVIGPIEVGDAELYVNGFEAGAREANPTITVATTYTGSFSDVVLAAEAAEDHVAVGADVMTGSAQMVVGAVSVANEADALWFGTQADQASLAPDNVVASQVYHWEVVLRPIIADIDAGTANGQILEANVANGGIVVEFNPEFDLAPEVRQRADELLAEIGSGERKVVLD